MFLSHLLDGLLVAFVLGTGVTVILQDILLLHLKRSHLLLGKSLLVLKLLLLSLEEVVRLSRFGEFLIYKLVLASQGLDVLSELGAFGLLDVDDLGEVVDLLSEGLVFLSEEFDFVFSLEQASLEFVFLA
jgi:hypothetical protein